MTRTESRDRLGPSRGPADSRDSRSRSESFGPGPSRPGPSQLSRGDSARVGRPKMAPRDALEEGGRCKS